MPKGWPLSLCPRLGKVQEGERVLIHAGASGVGMAAIQLVRLAKAIPIVTAGTQEKLEATANAGAAAGFNYKNEDFSEKVLEFTQGKNLPVKVLMNLPTWTCTQFKLSPGEGADSSDPVSTIWYPVQPRMGSSLV